MSVVLQWALVTVLVIAAALYALWRLLPAEWKWRALQRVAPAPAMQPSHLPAFIQRWIAQQQIKLTQGGCSSCSSHSPPRANPPNGNAR